jgi:hypothetical protein
MAPPASAPIAAGAPEESSFEKPTPQVNGVDPAPVPAETGEDDGDVGELSPVFSSAASMATEILSASPDTASVATPEDPEQVLISQDVTLIARGRRKRFRLH